MTQDEFRKYIPVLETKPFVLHPPPEGFNAGNNKFEYVDCNATHVEVRGAGNDYKVPLVLVEFANPGLLRLTRATKKFNGSFG